jgi:hypothetical protein
LAGFAALVSTRSTSQVVEDDFQHLLGLTAQYKQLKIPAIKAAGSHCIAGKLDSAATLHHGIVHDPQSGSWILAAGTVVALEGDNDPTTVLKSLLHAYINDGNDAFEQYDGHFGLVIYNGRDESISVVSDPIGLYSIFYGQRGTQIFVSNSALAVAKQIQSQPNILAAEHFLRTGRLDADNTLWQDVKRLFGATVLKVTDSRLEKIEYWSPSFDISVSRLPLFEALDLSTEMLTHTFSRILTREGKTWIDLTGGFDSRLAAMIAAKINTPFSVYCTGPEDHPDVQLSRKIGEKMGWEHVHTQLPEQWESDQYSWFDTALGYGDGNINVLRLSYVLRGFIERNAIIKTNVMGVGGENWRGYYWQIEKEKIGKTNSVNYEALLDFLFSTPIPLQVMRHDRTREVRIEQSDFAHQLCSMYGEYPNTVQLDRFEIYRDAGHGGAYLSASASIGRSLAPLCFKDPVNFAFSLNYRWKLPRHHHFIRELLERENKNLASIATTTGGPAIPIRLTNIHQFLPLWLSLANRVVLIGGKKFLGKTVQIWPQPSHSEYPLPAWRSAFRMYARSEGLLNYENMCSGGLYQGSAFNSYIERVEHVSPHSSEFVDRIISLEMAMRATGSSID